MFNVVKDNNSFRLNENIKLHFMLKNNLAVVLEDNQHGVQHMVKQTQDKGSGKREKFNGMT